MEPEDEDEFGDWTIGETTFSLSECVEEGCTECREGFYANYPEYTFATCVDTTVYKYGNICVENSKWNESQCSYSGNCHKSYPFGDADKMNSEEAACRTVPQNFVENDFAFGTKDCWSPVGGLCHGGCEGTCHYSWIASDDDKWKSASSMCRCKN